MLTSSIQFCKNKGLNFSYFKNAILWFLVLFWIAPAPSFAQSTTTLRVLVNSGEDGGPLIGANVFLLEPESREIVKSGATDNDGFIEFRGIDAGEYLLQATYIGFKDYLETITVGEKDIRVERINMAVEVAALDEFVVEAERLVTTGEVGMRKISRRDISRIPSPVFGGDLGSYLQTVPGVITSGDRGGELYIRGGTPSQNKVLVDNLPVVKPFHIFNLFSAFPKQAIQSVDLYAGGFGAQFNDATSAIIDVNLSPGNFKEFSGSGAVSPYIASVDIEGPVGSNEDQSFMLMGRKSIIEQTSPNLTGDKKPFDFYDVIGRFSYSGDNYTCNFTGLYTYDNGKINNFRNINLSWQNAVAGGRCLGFAENFNHPIEITAGYSYFTNAEKGLDQTERESDVGQLFFKFDHEENLFGLPFDYGLKLNFRTYNATLAERFTRLESFNDKQAVVSLYASTVWEPNEYLRVEPSLGAMGTLITTPTFEPRLRILYKPGGSDDIEISAAAGRYYQTLTGLSDVRNAGTVFKVWQPIERDLNIPSALHGLLGYKQQIGDHFIFNIEGYVKDHKNISVTKWDPVAKLETGTTKADGFAYGGDAQIEYQNDPLYFMVSYGYSKVKYEAATDDLGAWLNQPVFSYNPRHDQRHKVNSIVSYEIGGFTANASWEFGSGQPYTRVYGFDLGLRIPEQDPRKDPGTARTLYSRPFGGRLPVYHRLDVSVERSFQLSTDFKLSAEIGAINVYDRNNIFYYDSNTLRRVNQTSLLPYVAVQAQIN